MVLDDAGLAERLDLHALLESPLRQVLLRLVEDPEKALSLILFERANHFTIEHHNFREFFTFLDMVSRSLRHMTSTMRLPISGRATTISAMADATFGGKNFILIALHHATEQN